MFEDGKFPITSSDILKKMTELGCETQKLSDTVVGRKRSGLGIEAKQVAFKDKKGKSFSKKAVLWNTDVMESLMKQYIPMHERKKYEKMFEKSADTNDW